MPRPRLPRLLAALLAACALGAAGAPAAPAARGMEVALQDDAVFVDGPVRPVRAYALAREIEVSRLRIDVNWFQVPGARPTTRTRPASVTYDWSAYDAAVDAAAAAGIRVQMTVTGPVPAWATGNRRLGTYRPSVARYAAFVRAVATHFRGRVDRYSIWSEPNFWAFLGPAPAAASIYRSLYVSGSAAIRAADPGAAVLIGELAPYAYRGKTTAPLAFLRGVTCVDARYRRIGRCATLTADGIAHHPYDVRHAPTYRYPGSDNVTIGTLGRLTSAADRLSAARALRTRTGRAMPIYLTEFGYRSSGTPRFAPATRARYLSAAFGLAQANPRVRQLLQYILVSPPPGTPFDTSIVDADGTPQPAFTALKAWTRGQASRRGILVPPSRVSLPPARPSTTTPT